MIAQSMAEIVRSSAGLRRRRHLASLTSAERVLKAAFASSAYRLSPVFGGGAGLVCGHHTYFVSA